MRPASTIARLPELLPEPEGEFASTVTVPRGVFARASNAVSVPPSSLLTKPTLPSLLNTIARGRMPAAMSAMRSNEVVSIDRLIEDFWGEQAPPSAPKVIQGYVSQLRRALPPGGPSSAAWELRDRSCRGCWPPLPAYRGPSPRR